jgi:hypothetical protein
LPDWLKFKNPDEACGEARGGRRIPTVLARAEEVTAVRRFFTCRLIVPSSLASTPL